LPWVDRVSRSAGNGLSLLFMAAVVLTTYEVVMRYVFNAPTIWVHDVVTVLSATAFVFGGALASQQRTHIQMASYADRFPPRLRLWVDQFCYLLTAAYLAMFVYGALVLAVPSVRMMETSGRAWDVPVPAFLKAMLAVGAILMLVQTLSHLWHKKPQKPDGPETVI
jgi:TRAP-type C4-dicarboxylate transport system permease small subunit